MSILDMSISASLLIMITLTIRGLAINRLPKSMFLTLWSIALFRLIVPFSISSAISIFNVFKWVGIFKQSPQINGSGVILSSVGTPGGAEMSQAFRMYPLMIIWIAGVAAAALFFIFAFYKSYRGLQAPIPLDNQVINKWQGEQKILRNVRIVVSDKTLSPLTTGIIRPAIIIPKTMDLEDESLVRLVLTHELIHIKHFDTLWKLIMIAALCLHWFNPMVWVMYIFLKRDLELGCDEKVIKMFGEKMRSDYALSIIGMAEQKSKIMPLYNGFSKNSTEERIVSIMKFKKKSILVTALSIAIVASATTAFATTSDTKNPADNNSAVKEVKAAKYVPAQGGAIKDENGNALKVVYSADGTAKDENGNNLKVHLEVNPNASSYKVSPEKNENTVSINEDSISFDVSDLVSSPDGTIKDKNGNIITVEIAK